MENKTELTWKKAGGCVGGNCVEVAAADQVHVRDSKRPEDGYLTVSREAFARFLADLKDR